MPLCAAGGFAEITHFKSENIVVGMILTKKENDQKKKRTTTNKQEFICDKDNTAYFRTKIIVCNVTTFILP